MFSCLQYLFQYIVCCGMLRLRPLLVYFVSGRVAEKKIILLLSEWFSGKIIFPGSLCANTCLVLCSCNADFAAFLKAPADIFRDCLTLSNSHLVTISNPPGNTEGFWHFTEPRLLLTPILFMNQAVKTAGSDCRHFRSRNISGKVKGVTKGCVVWVITTCYLTVSILLVIVDFCFPSPGQPHEPGPMLDVNARATYPVLVLSHSDISFFSSLSSMYFPINLSPFPISCPAGTEALHPSLQSVSPISPLYQPREIPCSRPLPTAQSVLSFLLHSCSTGSLSQSSSNP